MSLELLDHLREHSGTGLTDLARQMGKPKSTVHGHLTTLMAKEFVIREGDEYYLGPELVQLGHHVRLREEAYILGRVYVNKLLERTNLRSIFVDR